MLKVYKTRLKSKLFCRPRPVNGDDNDDNDDVEVVEGEGEGEDDEWEDIDETVEEIGDDE